MSDTGAARHPHGVLSRGRLRKATRGRLPRQSSPCSAVFRSFIRKMFVTFERRTFLGDFPRQIWALGASTSRWDLEKWTLGFRKCASVHFRLLFLLSVTLKVIGAFPDDFRGVLIPPRCSRESSIVSQCCASH